jgi:hypothetical protein
VWRARARIPGRLELPHVLLTPSGGLVQNLAAAAGTAASPRLNVLQDLTLDSAAGPVFIRHNALGMYRKARQRLAKEALVRLHAAMGRNQHIKRTFVLTDA